MLRGIFKKQLPQEPAGGGPRREEAPPLRRDLLRLMVGGPGGDQALWTLLLSGQESDRPRRR